MAGMGVSCWNARHTSLPLPNRSCVPSVATMWESSLMPNQNGGLDTRSFRTWTDVSLYIRSLAQLRRRGRSRRRRADVGAAPVPRAIGQGRFQAQSASLLLQAEHAEHEVADGSLRQDALRGRRSVADHDRLCCRIGGDQAVAALHD
jgi:hypothetical protein